MTSAKCALITRGVCWFGKGSCYRVYKFNDILGQACSCFPKLGKQVKHSTNFFSSLHIT